MTIRRTVLCADAVSLQHPELLGLEGESLEAQSWLTVFSDAQAARSFARVSVQSLEIWVAGSDQMEGINLAAAMKRDRRDADVSLLAFSGSGSLLSRAHAAGINDVLDCSAFLNRYRLTKRSHELAMAGDVNAFGQAPMRYLGAEHPGNAQGSFGSGFTSVGGAAQHAAYARTVLPQHAAQSAVVTCGPASTQAGFDSTAGASSRAMAEPVLLPGTIPSAVPVQQASAGYVITVVGAGGGTGKSTIAAMVACCAQGFGRKTVIVDGDLQMGDIAYLMGSESPLYVDDLAEAPLRVAGLECNGRLPAVVAAPRRMERSECAEEHLAEVIEMLKQRFDVVVVNTGTAWSDMHLQLMESSSNVLFVVDQRPSSIRACKHVLELCSRCGIASKPFLFAVNRCSRKALFSSIDVSCALQGAHVHEIQDGGRAVEEVLGMGRPLELIDSGNAFAKSVSTMVSEILPASPSGETKEIVIPQKKRRGIVGRRNRS